MNKITHTIVFIAAALFLPLLGQPILLLDPRTIILAIAGILLLVSQPTLDLREAAAHRAADRSSFLLILIAGLLSQISAVVEWAYLREFSPFAFNRPEIIAGLVLWSGGLAFRIWSIRTLGKFFTVTVQRVDGHRVIKHGPYAIVRHPSYLGAIVAMLGSSVLLAAWFSLFIGATLLAIAYYTRILAEERLLVNEFGDEYRNYIASTPALLPLSRRLSQSARGLLARLSQPGNVIVD